MNWITFAYSLSKEQSSARVTLWRRLQRLGAVAPAGNLYILPARPACIEAFQWLTQEIQSAGGQAIMLYTKQVEGMTEDALIHLFCDSREKEYRAIEEEIEQLEADLSEQGSEIHDTLSHHLKRLQRQHGEIIRIDYFDCPQGQQAYKRLAEFQQKLRGEGEDVAQIELHSTADFLGKTWATRPKPHVDRLASIWLIRRFIDPQATIVYTNNPPSSAVSFDMPKGQFTHVGRRCTFEVLMAAFQIDAAGLKKVGEIVHEIDLQDDLVHHPESAGIEAVLQGWLAENLSDEEREKRGLALFDGLLAGFQGKP